MANFRKEKMKKITLVLAFLAVSFMFSKPAFASESAGNSASIKNELYGIKLADPRIATLTAFLSQFDSPLSVYATNFIESADKNNIDWKLVVAISGVESTFGKHIPYGSFNAYGWSNGNYYFQSWEQSIEYVSAYLKDKYYNRGLDTPYKIGPVYAPPSSTWAGKVAYFMKLLENFNENSSPLDLDLTI